MVRYRRSPLLFNFFFLAWFLSPTVPDLEALFQESGMKKGMPISFAPLLFAFNVITLMANWQVEAFNPTKVMKTTLTLKTVRYLVFLIRKSLYCFISSIVRELVEEEERGKKRKVMYRQVSRGQIS